MGRHEWRNIDRPYHRRHIETEASEQELLEPMHDDSVPPPNRVARPFGKGGEDEGIGQDVKKGATRHRESKMEEEEEVEEEEEEEASREILDVEAPSRPGAFADGGRMRSSGLLSHQPQLRRTNSLRDADVDHVPVIAEVVGQQDLKQVSCFKLYQDKRVWSVNCLLLLAVIVVGVIRLPGQDSGFKTLVNQPEPTPAPTVVLNTISPTAPHSTFDVTAFLIEASPDNGTALTTQRNNAQKNALNWILNEDLLLPSLPQSRILQRYALQVLRWVIRRENGVEFGYGYDNGTSSECEWEHVTCNLVEEVIEVDFRKGGYTMTLPEELVLLSSMRVFRADDNQGYGTLPAVYGTMESLQELFLSSSGGGYTGTIPLEWTKMRNLYILALCGNKLTGTIPTEFGLSTTLVSLDFDSNNLEGSIPPQLFEATSLIYLDLYHNNLNGTIPTTIGNTLNLQYVYLMGNKLTGPLPSELQLLTNIRDFQVHDNQLSGRIPDYLENFQSLSTFDVSFNRFTGKLPLSLTLSGLSGLLGLNNNTLSGTIPTEFGRLRELKEMRLSGNMLEGTIPSELGFLSKLRNTLTLSRNNLSGTIPSELGKLTSLESLELAMNSGLTGTFPEELGNMTSLVHFLAFGNGINGSVPTSLCALSSLERLVVDCDVLCTCCGEVCF